jgi:hypothetical protein
MNTDFTQGNGGNEDWQNHYETESLIMRTQALPYSRWVSTAAISFNSNF